MKIQTSKKSVEMSGDIEENKVSIDNKNLDFIIMILSTSLYSNPISSFIRETTSNAWDSHVEAKNDDPIILELGRDTNGEYYCEITDYGVGLSVERFDSIYRNIGSSTKRGSNKQIGGFGIGRFSALAVSNSVNITSRYGGKEYQYLMYKDGNSVSIDLLSTIDTKEGNGVKVRVGLKVTQVAQVKNSVLTQLQYFENIHVEDNTGYLEDLGKQYLDSRVKKYRTFSVNTHNHSGKDAKNMGIMLGKVWYPLNLDSLDTVGVEELEDYPLDLSFDIGDLEVTPNREQILYSERNVDKILDKIELLKEELKEISDVSRVIDTDGLEMFLEEHSKPEGIFLYGKDTSNEIFLRKKINREITLKGVYYDVGLIRYIKCIIEDTYLFKQQYSLKNGSIRSEVRHSTYKQLKENKIWVYKSHIPSLKNITKSYIREMYSDGDMFFNFKYTPFTLLADYYREVKTRIEKSIASNSNTTVKPKVLRGDYRGEFRVIMKEVLDFFSNIETIDDQTVPEDWIKQKKEKDRLQRKMNKSPKEIMSLAGGITLHKYRRKDSGCGSTTDPVTDSYSVLKKSGKLFVYEEKGNSTLATLFSYTLGLTNQIKFVGVAKTKLKYLEQLDNFLTIEEFMQPKVKIFRNLCTAMYLQKEIPRLEQLSRIHCLEKIRPDFAKAVRDLYNFVRKYKKDIRHRSDSETTSLEEQMYEVCEKGNYFNEEIRGLYLEYKKIFDTAETIILFTDDIDEIGEYPSYGSMEVNEKRVNLLVDYLLARKVFRPSLSAVNKLKKETILNLIPEDNESN